MRVRLALKCPELDVKLIVTNMNLGVYRAKLIAKFLEVASRTDIAVAIGHGGREGAKWFAERKAKKTVQSSTLFDTVAVYLAIQNDFCKMETLPIRVTDEGVTVIDPQAKQMQVATEWNDREAFEDWVVDRLTAKPAAH